VPRQRAPNTACDARLNAFTETAEAYIAKLRRYTTGVDATEMQWTPADIANSLAWIVRHCADLLWLSYGRLAGERIPVDLGVSDIAWSSVKGATFDEAAQEPGPDAQERVAYLERAWETLEAYLRDNTDWKEVELAVGRRRQSAWAYLQHSLGELCYHTGQASYLRKLLAAERRRVRARRQRAEKAAQKV
jgi:hypothetical protein